MAFAATAKIAPPIDTRYGGYCAFGVAMGKKFETETQAWKIENGKLYINLDKTVQNPWWENTQKFIRDASFSAFHPIFILSSNKSPKSHQYKMSIQ